MVVVQFDSLSDQDYPPNQAIAKGLQQDLHT